MSCVDRVSLNGSPKAVRRRTSICSTSKAKRSRAHEDAGQRERVRGVPRRSEPHSPPQTWLGKSREQGGALSRRTGPYSWRLTLQSQGNPPRDKGAPTQGTVGAVPRTERAPTQGLAFRCPRGIFVHRSAPRAVGGRRRTCWTSPPACWRSIPSGALPATKCSRNRTTVF